VCVRVTPKTELSTCAAAMMHILIVKFSFAVQSMVWPTSCRPNNRLLAGGPNYLSSQPQQFILTEEALSPETDPTNTGMHCIVLYATTSRSRDYDRFAKTYIHSAHPTHHLTLTLSPLSIHVKVVSSFNLCLLVLGSGLVQIGVGVVSTCVYWFWVLENLTLGSINFLGNHH
jgi:hypothetical protein